jgi:uncharacterized membrane-anchored protein
VPDHAGAAHSARRAGGRTRDAGRAAAGGILCASDNSRHAEGTIGPGLQFVWEQHSEACGITLFIGEEAADPAAAMAWVERFPGEAIRATRIHLVVGDAEAEALLPQMGFVGSDLVSCQIGVAGCGCGRISASGRRALASRWWRPTARAGDLARLLQRFQELGNYRNLALMGLPVAQGNWRGWMRQRRLCAGFPPMWPGPI